MRPNRLLWFAACALAVGTVFLLPCRAVAGNGKFDSASRKFNMVVSVRWNATQAELDAICAEFQTASGILLDATDGGNQLGVVLIANNSTASNAADYWILNQNGTSSAPTCTFGTNGQHVTMFRGTGAPAARYEEVIVHETAHYVYCVRDEYEGPATGNCGAANCSDNPSAACIGSAAASACLMEGPDANDSEFCVAGNHDPDQDTEQHCDKCQSCWETMAARPFGLTVPAGNPIEAAPAADPIACVFLDDVPRIVLVLDRSGSMAGTPLQEARKAAKLVVDLVEAGTFLGVTSFSTDAGPNPNFALQAINTAADRTAAKNAIDGLSAGGATNYAAGLDLARSELVRVGLNAASKSIIFLSDGMNNEPAPDPDGALNTAVQQYVADGTVINTVGIGSALSVADEARLQGMAQATGGQYARNPIPLLTVAGNEHAGVPFVTMIDESVPIVTNAPVFGPTLSFARFWATAAEHAEHLSSEFTLTSNAEVCRRVHIDGTISEATFLMYWRDSGVAANPMFRLRTPTGTFILPSHSGLPGIVYVSDAGSNYALFKITAPALQSGDWEACVVNDPPPPGGLPVGVQVFSRSSDIWAVCSLRQGREGVGAQVFIETTPIFLAPLTNVYVPNPELVASGEFTLTGKFTTAAGDVLHEFQLYDDGRPGDQLAGDGRFVGRVPGEVFAALSSGTYVAEVEIVNEGGAIYAGAHAKPEAGESSVSIPNFQRQCVAAVVYDRSLNTPPVCLAGGPYEVECAGATTSLTLDGSLSSDPDGDVLSYAWTSDCPGAAFDDPTSPRPVLTIATSGVCDLSCEVRLTVSDGLESSSCSASLRVVDTTPPTIQVELNRDVLWPPNHKLSTIEAQVDVADVCDPSPTFVLTSVTSNEPENGLGDGDTAPDIVGAATGTADLVFQLRSERSGTGKGRVYTIIYTASDGCGNAASDTVRVRVPHDRAGTAFASVGFVPSGGAVQADAQGLALVVPSIREDFEMLAGQGSGQQVMSPNDQVPSARIALALDATRIDAARAYLGNVEGVIAPLWTLVADVDADGVPDLALLYAAEAVRSLVAIASDPLDPVGLHFVTSDGTDYVVRNIFELGSPIDLGGELPDLGRTPGNAGRAQGSGNGSDLPVATTPRATPLAIRLVSVNPNPFARGTTIAFELDRELPVRISIYDLRGALVRTLLAGTRPAGHYVLAWDGRDETGHVVGTGIYLVHLDAGGVRQTRKGVLIE